MDKMVDLDMSLNETMEQTILDTIVHLSKWQTNELGELSIKRNLSYFIII